ncbi:MAG: MerR family transcriptional regulator, partial [Myxococcota bacterium]
HTKIHCFGLTRDLQHPYACQIIEFRLGSLQDTAISRGARFQTREVLEILQISRRQLQYWAQTRLVEPSAKTPGGHSRYTFEDLVALKAAKRLIDSGVSVQRIRASIGALRKILPTVERPLAELVLVATGDVVLVFRDGMAFDAVSGQEWVFEVAHFEREVESYRRSIETSVPTMRKAKANTRSDSDRLLQRTSS